MPYPTAIVEVAFTDGPYVAYPTWTAITSYVREITVRRGRASEVENFEAGTATLVLDNRDRRFDPFYTSGPYYGNLLPRRQIRIRATNNSTTYDVFRGYVEGWPVTLTDAGYDSTVTVQAYDTLGLLADEELPDDLSDHYIRSLSPRHYWPLDDPVNILNPAATVFYDYGSQPLNLAPQSGIRVGNLGGLAAGLSDTCLSIADGNNVEVTAVGTTVNAIGNVTVSCWWVLPQPELSVVIFQVASGLVIEATYDVATSTLEVALFDGTNVTYWRNATTYLDNTIPHHIVVAAVARTTAPTVWVDGIAVTVTAASTAAFTISLTESATLQNGQFQQLAVFGTYFTATQARQLFTLGASKIEESTADRFNRLVQYTPVVAGYAPVGTFTGTVLGIGSGGPPVTQELQTTADSEGGNLYVTKDGILTITGRNRIFEGRSLTSQATFGGAGITIEPTLAYRIDAGTMRNTLAIGYTGDGSVEITDAASVSANGTAGGSLTTQLSTIEQAETLGEMLVGFSQNPTTVLEPFRVNVAATTAGWDSVLALELLDRITVEIVPRTGSSITVKQLVQAIEWTIVPGEWSCRLTGSTRFTNPFIIGESLLGGTDLLV
jgi:hypothetical protein